ncbi:RNA-guided pseudouridylation complex pseudouridine synthase subunit Cbf5 [Candidatus Woesearchaeota archaeon]|nr:RNA-guided pseudouridylation complex pseudouridine synthase subunit Cbf5 [Candidatus Woesearchaeota archaeon]
MEKHDSLPFEKVKRETLIKKRDAATSTDHGCSPNERQTEDLVSYGIINLDKPAGPTSHQVTSYVRDILGVKKCGHSGTLDPNVTGILPIAVGRATRIVQLLLTAGKEYICLMHIHKEVPEERLRQVIAEFTGKIKQLPPVRSSVKRQLRERTVYYFEVLEIDGKDVLFKVGTQAGTYIRKLVSDIGGKVGGAHMVELRRTKAGPFNETGGTVATLQDVSDAYHYYKNEGNDKLIRRIIQPVENAVAHIPKIWVMDSTIESLCHGAPLHVPGIAKLESGIRKGDTIAIMSLKDELIAYGKATEDSEKILKDEKGLAAKPEAVFMKEGTYPRLK